MLFNSIEFLVFFPLVTVLYFALPHRFRWIHLLLASCIFYCAFIPVYIFILFFTILIDYFAGIWIESASGERRKLFLTLSIVANVGVLAVFKYYNFFIDNMDEVLQSLHLNTHFPLLSIILPIGLSFHTFQAMSYTIEVYRGNYRAERHLGIYALYVMFYPQLVAGPIERPQNLLPQVREKHYFQYERVTSGLKLMMWGMFKKVVIADRLAVFVNEVYGKPTTFQGLPLIVATIFFAIQIYCDFSGYSDIAIGAARVMGFKLMQNFNRPYFSKTIAEFWQRWHISLSTWFRDYLYISIGGNRVSKPRLYFNLLFVFLVSGFWHGANWTFVVWGALHGIYLIIGLTTRSWRAKFNELTGLVRSPELLKVIDIGITFSMVTFAWIFFRASTIQDAGYILSHLFASGHSLKGAIDLYGPQSVLAWFHKKDILIIVLSIGLMECVHFIQRRQSPVALLSRRPIWFRWAVYYALIMIIVTFGSFEKTQFIYFQF